MATVVVVGEVVVDRFVTPAGVADVAGGSAANTALAMRVAGHIASLRARFSDDDAGRFLRDHAISLGLDITDSVDAPEPATVVTVTLQHGSPTYAFAMEGTADWQWSARELGRPLPAGCQAVVVGSLAAVLEPGCEELAAWAMRVRAEGVLVAYDPNARPTAIQGSGDAVRARMGEWVRASDIVKVSDEDLAWIAPGQPPHDIAREWSTQGPSLVVLTAGPQGAWAFMDGEAIGHCAPPPVAVVDTVGAGDTLMGWLVAGVVDADALGQRAGVIEALQRAVDAAAVTCTRQGCRPPTASEV